MKLVLDECIDERPSFILILCATTNRLRDLLLLVPVTINP